MPKIWDCPGRVAGPDMGDSRSGAAPQGGHEAAGPPPHPQAQCQGQRQVARAPRWQQQG